MEYEKTENQENQSSNKEVSSLLEYFNNTVTMPVNQDGSRFEIAKCHCRSWFCRECCSTMGYNLRARLIPILETFDDVIMASLTVDPTLFPDPQTAYFYTMDKRCISVTTQDLYRWNHLKTRRYFYVVEWQKKTEQAHYHIIYDARFIPFDAIFGSWSKHRPENAGAVIGNRPAFGTAMLSKIKFKNSLHAARYVTKYLTKTPEHGYPAWVLLTGKHRRIRRYRASKGFWGLPSHRSQTPAKTSRKNKQLTYAERIDKCGDALNVFEIIEKVNTTTGEISSSPKWYGQIIAPADTVLDSLYDPQNPKRRRRSLLANNASDVQKIIENITGEEAPWNHGGNDK